MLSARKCSIQSLANISSGRKSWETEIQLKIIDEREQPRTVRALLSMTLEDNDVPLKRRQMSYSSMKVLHNARNEIALSKKYAVPLTDVKYEIQKEYVKQNRTDRQKKN